MSWKERCEIQVYKLVSLMPVTCTFTLYIFISIFYIFVSTPSDSLPMRVSTLRTYKCDDNPCLRTYLSSELLKSRVKLVRGRIAQTVV